MTKIRDEESYEKGRQFEAFIINMFPEQDFEIIGRADTAGSKLPDFHIKDLKTKEMFWVEAK